METVVKGAEWVLEAGGPSSALTLHPSLPPIHVLMEAHSQHLSVMSKDSNGLEIMLGDQDKHSSFGAGTTGPGSQVWPVSTSPILRSVGALAAQNWPQWEYLQHRNQKCYKAKFFSSAKGQFTGTSLLMLLYTGRICALSIQSSSYKPGF